MIFYPVFSIVFESTKFWNLVTHLLKLMNQLFHFVGRQYNYWMLPMSRIYYIAIDFAVCTKKFVSNCSVFFLCFINKILSLNFWDSYFEEKKTTKFQSIDNRMKRPSQKPKLQSNWIFKTTSHTRNYFNFSTKQNRTGC